LVQVVADFKGEILQDLKKASRSAPILHGFPTREKRAALPKTKGASTRTCSYGV